MNQALSPPPYYIMWFLLNIGSFKNMPNIFVLYHCKEYDVYRILMVVRESSLSD